ncbi:MAG: hypothetical protein KAU60_09140, partial [Desulfobacterales bacterium]|nr:hypothetical protein [Desulfobacterales bacterium]
METKDDNKTCDEETGSAEGAGNPEEGKETGPAQEGNPGLQTGPVPGQTGPVPGQTPFPYGYFQSPNLHPGYYMAQGGFPQGQMPGYWMPPGYGNFPPYMYMQPGSAAPQGANPANPGNSVAQDPAGGAGAQDNSGQFQQHDAPGDAGGPDNAGYAPGDNGSGQGAAPGHHKEPGHDELKYGTYMEKPDHVDPGQAPEMAEEVSAFSGLTSFLQLDNDSFWKGILVGSLATLLVTNSTVKKGIMKTVIKASASVKGGVEELKEQLADVEAEVLH